MQIDEQTKENIRSSFYNMEQAFQQTEAARQDPHVLMRPTLSRDGDKWCALYGDNLQDGVAGFGNSPGDAMIAFDSAWWIPTNAGTELHHER